MTNFALNILGKSIADLTLADIENYFTEQKLETDTLEFKSFPAAANFEDLLGKIMKTLCGYLNGSGGLLILGAPIKTVVGNVDYFQGALTPVPVQKSVDWFINKISSSISPMPINVSVKIIPSNQSYIYLFEVQESQYKPHQVAHIYYIRLDGQTKPAPHYIVQALMRQITYPDLRATIRINRFQNHAEQTISKLTLAIFNFSQMQNDSDFHYYITLIGGAKFFAWDANQYGPAISFDFHGAQLRHREIQRTLHFGVPYTASYQITIPENVQELKIMVNFGARQSPSKISIYTLPLINIDRNNPAAHLVIEKENTLFEAIQSIEETLSHFRNNEIL
ncbi:helix-turn-helix domain-containing protein [Pedobacter sp. UBA5917]|jgi:hypothetical protein|uniref:AlbA family DNA-binding domain-containing protein n=1 Tax=Pedobacter sp. UBA5917 TaxID=1947061 RepID=UPI0025E1E310|nr:ATP-binding protein [Pedobacter sp. UBA5917]